MKKNILLVIMLITISLLSNAQIIYTDIPDGIPTGIDFNSDGADEFEIFGGDGSYITYTGNNNIHALGSAAIDWDVPNCVAANFAVNATNNWVGQGDCSIDGWGQGNSSLIVNQDKYLAVKFQFVGNVNFYYGWIRISRNSLGIITYKDYAYNSTANQQILTGQSISISLNEVKKDKNVLIYPNPVKNILYINFKNGLTENVSYEIYNTLGQTVKRSNLEEKNLNEINISDLNKGVYSLRLYTNNQKIEEKIFID